MKEQFGFVFLFFLAGLFLVFAVISISQFLRKDKPNPEKNATYESGEEAIGNSRVVFNFKFFVLAIVFLLFDVEIVLLFPWATIFSDKAIFTETQGQWMLFSGIEMLIFVGLLALGLAYVWKNGHLDWIKSNQITEKKTDLVPPKLYEEFNKSQS